VQYPCQNRCQTQRGWASQPGLVPAFCLVVTPLHAFLAYAPRELRTFEYLHHSGWTDQALAPRREIPCPKGWRAFKQRPADL
jgi:hypothetical protein